MYARLEYLLASAVVVTILSGCEFSSRSDPVIVSGNFPIVYIKRPQNIVINSTDSNATTAHSDLFFRDVSSPNSVEKNLTNVLTLGKGDIADPEVSFDGKQIVFSMRCTLASAAECSADNTWNIWIYNIAANTFKRVIAEFETANLADDVDPAFLTNERIVFSSTRQVSISQKNDGYVFTDEKARKPVSVLHTMDVDGGRMEQISFNRGHDKNPTVLRNGKIIFSHWELEEEKSQFAIYSVNPDGSEMNVLYGAHSPGEVFLHPREMADGKLISTVIPATGTWESGALMIIDIENYSDATEPAPRVRDKSFSGQQSATIQKIPLNKTVSLLGRFTTPYPLLDNSNQILVSFSFLQVLSGNESIFDQLNAIDDQEAPPSFGIYILNTNDKSLKPLVLAQSELSLTDPIAIFPRPEPPIIQRTTPENPGVFDTTKLEGILNIKSVYDTDHFGRMGEAVLTAQENALTPFPQVPPSSPNLDTRQFVTDIAKLKDPMQTPAAQRPARFIRITSALPIPKEFSTQTLGETDFVMRKIIGYAPVEPDGSVKIKVPADVPISIAVLDQYGRAYENRSNWIQVRPGETLTCNGCHAPQKFVALNSSPIAGNHPNTSLRTQSGQTLAAIPNIDETMAETRTRLDETALELSRNVFFTDVWTDQSLRAVDPEISYLYENLPVGTVPIDGIINYPDHIQPIWNALRLVNGKNQACSSCHDGVRAPVTNPSGLNLKGGLGVGRMWSYNNLLIGQGLFDADDTPILEKFGNTRVRRRAPPLVKAGYARGSYLIEKLFSQELFADKALPTSGMNHSDLLTNDEKRLISEWVDIGAQYYNDPYDENGEIRKVSTPPIENFQSFYLDLLDVCAGCHSATGVNKLDVNLGFVGGDFELVRDIASDFFATQLMVTDLIDSDKSILLAQPSGALDDRHWSNVDRTIPYLPVDSLLYIAIKIWIESFGN